MMGGVVILGAGLSGLGAAMSLPGSRVFEANSHPGGHAYSYRMGDTSFDQGAHICHTKDRPFLDLIQALSEDVNQIASSRVANAWHGHWITYPVQNHLHELPPEHRQSALTDLVMAQLESTGEDASNYLDWCLQQYGEFLTERFYAEYTAKYWRVPMEDLATDWVSGRLLPSLVPRIIAGAFSAQQEEQPAFASFHYPRRGGFYAFVEPLFADIDITYDERVCEVDADRKVVSFESGRCEHYDELVTSLPLPDLLHRIKDVPGEIAEAGARLRHTQLVCVNMIVERPELTRNHWFYIYDDDIDAARVSLPDNLSGTSSAAGTTALQAEVFRRWDEPVNVDEIVERTVSQIGRLLDFSPGSELRQVEPVHVPHAYIVSDHDRAGSVDVILRWLEARDIASVGQFGTWEFLWSDRAFRSGERAANRIENLHESGVLGDA